MNLLQVWAAPFDVMYELVAAKAGMLSKPDRTPAEPGTKDRYPPGVRLMIAKLQGRSQ